MPMRSHPSWVCGLKHVDVITFEIATKSHPSWVCGLKHQVSQTWRARRMSHPSWVCGLKPSRVTISPCRQQSHPSWVCGLKQRILCFWQRFERHTLRGCVDWNIKNLSRIGMDKCHTLRGCVDWNLIFITLHIKTLVTPFVGVWIETLRDNQKLVKHKSHPSWVCGLKRPKPLGSKNPLSHTLRGCVDWNWLSYSWTWFNWCHTLRGCVDWNPRGGK